jgi:hypothetical protein
VRRQLEPVLHGRLGEPGPAACDQLGRLAVRAHGPYDFGEDVNIEIPADDEVLDFGDLGSLLPTTQQIA